MSEPGPRRSEGLFEEAAAWFARMRGPEAEASRGEFEAWLSRGALHRLAYNRAAEIFALGKILAGGPASPAGRRQGAALHRTARFAGTAALLFLLAFSWLFMRADPRLPESPVPAAPTQHMISARRIAASDGPRFERLGDGTIVHLQRRTSIAVELTRAARTLTLEHGGARFFVAHEPRPFLVFAGGGYVAARGTVFDVALGAGRRVTVRLVEGIVDVSPPVGAASRIAQPRRLRAGQSMSFDALPATGEPVQPLPRTAPPERAGEALGGSAISFDSVSLAELVRLANRGSARPIRIASPAAGRMLVSGTFRIDDTALLSERLAGLLGLAAEPGADEILLKPK